VKVFIKKNNLSYSPEIYAYSKYLKERDFKVDIDMDIDNYNINYDLIILLMGFYPNFNIKKYKNSKIIHEYSSLSLYPFSKIKNLIKYYFNSKPDGRIFNSRIIKKDLGYSDEIPFVYRDTGVDNFFFNDLKIKKEYDFVYTGSTGNVRKGLIEVFTKILKLGFSILVVGKISNELYNKLKIYNKIDFTGKQERRDLPELYQKAIYGLNYTPNLYPLNLQNSTKTVEYCASGLKVVSNNYYWVNQFMKNNNANFLWLENFVSRNDIESFNFITPDVRHLIWDKILDKIYFEQFVKDIIK